MLQKWLRHFVTYYIYSNDKAVDVGYLREIIFYFCAKNILIICGQPLRIMVQINRR